MRGSSRHITLDPQHLLSLPPSLPQEHRRANQHAQTRKSWPWHLQLRPKPLTPQIPGDDLMGSPSAGNCCARWVLGCGLCKPFSMRSIEFYGSALSSEPTRRISFFLSFLSLFMRSVFRRFSFFSPPPNHEEKNVTGFATSPSPTNPNPSRSGVT